MIQECKLWGKAYGVKGLNGDFVAIILSKFNDTRVQVVVHV